MIMVSAGLAGLAVFALLIRKTILGVLIGAHLLMLSVSILAIQVGERVESLDRGHLLGLIILLVGMIQLVGGFSFAVRLFYLRTKATLEEIEGLKG